MKDRLRCWNIWEGLLGSSHPDSLDDLEHGRSDHHENKEGLKVNTRLKSFHYQMGIFRTYNQLWTDGIFIISFRGFDHITPFGNIFGIFLIGFSHLRCARHPESKCCPGVLVFLSWIARLYWLMCSSAAALLDLLLARTANTTNSAQSAAEL